ncbi:MAG: hypothetical protein ACRC41_02980 [Sarcina sp.]
MDDHLLENLKDRIDLCFLGLKSNYKNLENTEYKNDVDYLAAKILISTYNKLVRIYYLPEFHTSEYLKSVDKEFKLYLEEM